METEDIFFQNSGQLEGLGWAAESVMLVPKKSNLYNVRSYVSDLSVCQIDFTLDEKQTKGVIDSTLSQVFEGQVKQASVKILKAHEDVTFLCTKELYETYHHISYVGGSNPGRL